VPVSRRNRSTGSLVSWWREYAANSYRPVLRTYGYRDGQLLITATAPPGINVAAAANGGSTTASETNSAPYAPSGAINGDRKLYLNNNAWANSTATMPQWLQVDFSANKVIDEIDVFSVQDASGSPSEPTLAMTFSAYGLTTFQAQYWNGSAWVTVSNGNITGNNKVWKQITFSPVTTNKIRIWITGSSDGYSRITEVEAWGTSVPVTRQNVAASTNGGIATASQTHSAPYAPSGAINGDRKLYLNNNAWSNSTATFPQWLQVDFNGSKDIDEIDVFSVQDLYNSPSEPTLAMTFSAYGLTAFQAQYWNGSAWVTVPNGTISSNSNVWKQITFSPISTTKIRIWITGSSDGYSRMTEVEAWGVPAGSGGPSAGVQWLISDHLGTPRMILDQTGNLNNIKRHDYLPFGEELVAPTGGRSAAQGYAGGDGVRQQFTVKERDVETGLDYFIARYYSSTQGRFTSIDPYNPILHSEDTTDFVTYLSQPQNWNRYGYVLNNPLKYLDPFGEDVVLTGSEQDQKEALERLRNQLGEERFNLLDFNQQNIEGLGNVTVVNFGSTQNRLKFEAIGDNADEIEYTAAMADIIGSSEHVEYRLAERFAAKGICLFGHCERVTYSTTGDYGGGATLNRDESWTGNVQIFVSRDATWSAFRAMENQRQKGKNVSSDGQSLLFSPEQVDAHEFGHAHNAIKRGMRTEEPTKALRLENIIRARQKSPNRRLVH
jgi:RHS repeat-associated protein